MSFLSRLRSLLIFATISFALFVIACKKESSPTPPPPSKDVVKISSLGISNQSKLFTANFQGKRGEDVYVTLIPHTSAGSAGEILFNPNTAPSNYSNSFSYIILKDDKTAVDPSDYEIIGNTIKFFRLGTYRVSGFVEAGEHNLRSDSAADIRIQVASNVPDSVFRAKLKTIPGVVFQGEILDTTSALDPSVPTSLSVAGTLEPAHIFSMEGVNFFRNLVGLNCDFSEVSDLKIDKLSKLQSLNSYNARLHSLDLRYNPELHYANVGGYAYLSDLLVAYLNKLDTLVLSFSNISNLDVTGLTNLSWLDCEGDPISSIDFRQLPKLKVFIGTATSITDIDIRDIPELKTINLIGCPLNSIAFDPFANSNPNLLSVGVPENYQCNQNLKDLKTYRGDNLTIYLGQSHTVTISNFNPLISCP